MASLMGKAADRVFCASRTDSQYSQHSHSPAASSVSSVAGKGSQVNEMNPERNEGYLPKGQQGDMLKGKERETEKEKCSLASAEETGIGKLALSAAGRYVAPPSNRHHDMSKDSLASRSLTRPTPTSTPAVMYSEITNPRIEGLSSETMDPRLIRRHLPRIQHDSVALSRALREHEPRGLGEGQPKVIDRVKRRDTFHEPASSSGSNLAESTRSPSSEDLQSASDDNRWSSRAQGEPQTQGERADLSTQWIRVKRLPFTRTRHLRNPWNHKQEVKVSRDGTELEPSVGQALLDEWDKEEPSGPETALATGGGGSASPASASAVGGGRRGTLHQRPQPRAQTALVVSSDLIPWSSHMHL